MLGTQSLHSTAVDEALSGSETTSTSETSTGAQSAVEEDTADYSVTDEVLVGNGYGRYTITGMLTNNTDDSVSYIQVEYVLKDAGGAQIGTGLANTNNLAAGGTWKFEAYCSVGGDEAPASFELADVTDFQSLSVAILYFVKDKLAHRVFCLACS